MSIGPCTDYEDTSDNHSLCYSHSVYSTHNVRSCDGHGELLHPKPSLTDERSGRRSEAFHNVVSPYAFSNDACQAM